MDTTDNPTCLDRYLGSFERSLSSRNYKPDTLKNYRHLLRRFAKLLEAERIEPSALTPDRAAELGRRLPAIGGVHTTVQVCRYWRRECQSIPIER